MTPEVERAIAYKRYRRKKMICQKVRTALTEIVCVIGIGIEAWVLFQCVVYCL